MRLIMFLRNLVSCLYICFIYTPGSDHPVLKTAKRLLYHGKNNMQVSKNNLPSLELLFFVCF